MKIALFLLSLTTSASAFAGSTYLCQPSESNLAPLKVFVHNSDKVGFATIVEGNQVNETVLSRDDSLNPAPGYVAFFGRGGCNQDGHGPHCFAIWQNTLVISNGMLSGVERGSATLNSVQYRCEIQ
jgi:hypothetical protein